MDDIITPLSWGQGCDNVLRMTHHIDTCRISNCENITFKNNVLLFLKHCFRHNYRMPRQKEAPTCSKLLLLQDAHRPRCTFISRMLYYLPTNWLAYLYGRIQSPRPNVMPDRREGITRAAGFVFACMKRRIHQGISI